MKVIIGPYKDWIGPYQLAEKLCFWAKSVPDGTRTKRPDWIYNFGTLLAHGTTDSSIVDVKDPPKTWLYKMCVWFHAKKQRKVKIRIDKYDTWNMNTTLALIVLPMLKQLQANKHGSAGVDDEDVPDELKSTSAPPKENEWDTDDNWHKRWDWVVEQMIWSFEQLQPECDWEAQYHTGVSDIEWIPSGDGFVELKRTAKDTTHFDDAGYKIHSDRITQGLTLFGKYYRGLWD